MTLLIAYLLMWQMGIDNGFAWFGVFVLWLAHITAVSSTGRS